jgi:N6-L-threonylcarbamoyladenine synthase
MGLYLGFDTSNYTTSAAVYDSVSKSVVSKKRLLPVKRGELGMRQSDAVFHHTVQLPEVTEELFDDLGKVGGNITAVGASSRPRDAEGSYMPCFLVGESAARCVSAADGTKPCLFSHQSGHIAASLFYAGRLDLLQERFIAFHVSGGTTEVVLAEPDDENIIKCRVLLSSLDLKAGQAVDRVGAMLGLSFPAGSLLDELAQKSDRSFKINISLKDGCCSLSGLQNKCETMKKQGESSSDISRFCIMYISAALDKMVEYSLANHGEMPLVFSGGVMSNSFIRKQFTEKYGAVFGSPEFSSDNAAGISVLTALKAEKGRKA